MDFDDDAPARDGRRSKGGGRSATRIGVVGLAVLSLAIVVNATFLQDQKRTAPLFKITLAETTTEPPLSATAPALTPLPPPTPIARSAEPPSAIAPIEEKFEPVAPQSPAKSSAPSRPDPIARELARLDAAAPQRDKQDKAPRVEPRRADPIAGLIRNGAPGSTATIERDKPAPTPSAAEVRAAQRALQHLGFVVKPDGAMTAATRHAIAQFARDRDIASNGDLTPRIQRELARAAAGEAQ